MSSRLRSVRAKWASAIRKALHIGPDLRELASEWYDQIWSRREMLANVPTQIIWGMKLIKAAQRAVGEIEMGYREELGEVRYGQMREGLMALLSGLSNQ